MTRSPEYRNTHYLTDNPFRNLPDQKKLIREGFLEINLPFDPKSEPAVLSNIVWHGNRIDEIRIDRKGQAFRVTIRNREPVEINLMVNQLFKNTPTDVPVSRPQAFSRIQKAKTGKTAESVLEFKMIPQLSRPLATISSPR
jgi:hypothetical protein